MLYLTQFYRKFQSVTLPFGKTVLNRQGRIIPREPWPLKTLLDTDSPVSFHFVITFPFLRKVTGEALTERCSWYLESRLSWSFSVELRVKLRWAACAVETGLVAMVDNVLTTDKGQVSVLDLQACQQLLTKLVMWFLLAHLCILIGTAKSHSAQPLLFGEAPGKSVAGGWAALRTMLTLTSLWLFSWVKCGDGISEVALSIGAAPL